MSARRPGTADQPDEPISDEEFWDQMSRLHSAIARLIRKRYTEGKKPPAAVAAPERPRYLTSDQN